MLTAIFVEFLGFSICAFAILEREYASSRTKEGLAKLKAQGKVLGRHSNFEY